jgi:hypothetical protein
MAQPTATLTDVDAQVLSRVDDLAQLKGMLLHGRVEMSATAKQRLKHELEELYALIWRGVDR